MVITVKSMMADRAMLRRVQPSDAEANFQWLAWDEGLPLGACGQRNV